MTKEWKRSLSQSDILSDGQPFDGAKIDAKISSVGANITHKGGSLAANAEVIGYKNIRTGVGSSPVDVIFNNDGSKIIVLVGGAGSVVEYDLAENFDITAPMTKTNSFDIGINYTDGLIKNSDGSKIYVVGQDNIEEYDLSTPYDTTTKSLTNTFDMTPDASRGRGGQWVKGGDELVIFDRNEGIVKFSASTAYDTTTLSFFGSNSTVTNTAIPYGGRYVSDGELLLINDGGNGIFQFAVNTAYSDFDFEPIGSSTPFQSELSSLTGMAINAGGSMMHVCQNSTEGLIIQLKLGGVVKK